MSYNPPILKDEIVDCLFCIGVQYTYSKAQTNKGLVRIFLLEDGSVIKISNQYSMTLDKIKCKSTYELKLALLHRFKDKI